jgi:DnaK suppressor protein
MPGSGAHYDRRVRNDTSSEALTKEQLDTLHHQLLAARDALRARPALPHPEAQVPEVGDAMDAADAASENEDAAVRTNRDRARLVQIENALGKFERGEYGVSERSGEPIGFGRLQAVPWARLTVEEEEELERRR